jgi:lipoprotein NlpI
MNLASAHLVATTVDDALADFTHAIELAPGEALAYLGRGRVELFSGRRVQSIDDFLIARRLQPTSVYAVLWLHIARLHQGEDDGKEFKENSERLERNAWPGLLIGLYEGTRAAAEFRTDAMEGAAGQSARICEIDFYLGEFEAYHASKDEARKLLTNAMNECPRHDINHFAAKAEIDLMESK